MTLSQAYQAFLRDRSMYCTAKTLKTYQSHMNIFFKFISDQTDFADVPDSLFMDYVIHLRMKDIKNVTVRSYCRPLKAFLHFCYDNDWCQDYLKRVKLPKDDTVPPEPLLQHEVMQLDAVLDNKIRNYCIVHLMLDCGLRSSEIIKLQIRDLDFENSIIHIRISKEMKSRIVLCPGFLLDHIHKYIDNRKSGYLFLASRGTGRLSENAIKQLFQDLKVKTGIYRIHAHLLRHTFATAYLIQGGNIEFLRVLMGHYDYSVTKIYSSLAAQYKMLHIPVYRLDNIFFEN